MDKPPNPGSDAARALGCKCPVLDNNHGLRSPWPPDGWFMVPSCAIHGRGEAGDERSAADRG